MTPQLRNWFAIVVLSLACLLTLLGALGHAREEARRANCLSNLHCCSLAFEMYAEVAGGRCPLDGKLTLAGSFRLLTNVTSSGKIFFCPSDSRPGARPVAQMEKLTTNSISYSYVPNLVYDNAGQDPTNTILWLDRIYTMTKGDQWPADSNHGTAGGNVAFLDGHVGFFHELPANLVDKDGQPIVLSP